jgi:hypothetical protein
LTDWGAFADGDDTPGMTSRLTKDKGAAMRIADPRAHVTRLIENSNHLGAYLYLKDAGLEHEEYVELVGELAGAVVNELSGTRREDKERIYFLRSILAWILRDVPGLGSLYREQLRESRSGAGAGLLGSVARGVRNAGDVATGKKSVSEGLQDAAEDVRQNMEDAADSVKSGEAGAKLNEFLNSAETGVRQGLDQLGDFFRTLNEQSDDTEPEMKDVDGSVQDAPAAGESADDTAVDPDDEEDGAE